MHNYAEVLYILRLLVNNMHTFFSVYFFRSLSIQIVPFLLWWPSWKKEATEKQQQLLLYILLVGFACRCIRLLFNFFVVPSQNFFVLVSDRFAKQQKENKSSHAHTLTQIQIQIHWLFERNEKRETVLKHYQSRHIAICMHFVRANATKKSWTRNEPTKRPTDCSIRLCKMQPHLQINYKWTEKMDK